MEEIKDISISVELQQLISSEMAWNYGVIPADKSPEHLSFYIKEDANIEFIKEDLEILTGEHIQLIPIPADVLQRNLGKIYRRSGNQTAERSSQNVGDKDDFHGTVNQA